MNRLVDAWRILFEDTPFPGDSLPGIDADLLRRRLCMLARRHHPDRHEQAPEQDAANRRFQEINAAYDFLRRRLRQRPANPRPTPTGPIDIDAGRGSTPQQRQLPPHPLPFARFCYLAGIVDWRQAIAAIVWQRQQRPRVGTIASGWHLLSDDAIQEVLTRRQGGEPFVACACRLGFLNAFQALAILGRQRRLQPRIGDYFLHLGLADTRTLERMASAQAAHNKTWHTRGVNRRRRSSCSRPTA